MRISTRFLAIVALAVSSVAVLTHCASVQLSPEYIVVQLEPDARLEHGGECGISAQGDRVAARGDFMVMIDGDCMGFVGQKIQLTRGVYEISVDIVGARTVVADIRATTSANPEIIVVRTARGGD